VESLPMLPVAPEVLRKLPDFGRTLAVLIGAVSGSDAPVAPTADEPAA